MTQAAIHILDRLTAVNLNVVIWTARTKLTAEDFGQAELPPEELASLGSKKICDPEKLKIFTALKARAVNLLEKTGVRFLGGWAIPEDRTEAVHDKFLLIRDEFQKAKAEFLANYDQAVKGWIDTHPGWERIISASTVSAELVRKRLNFNWQFYKVVTPDRAAETTGENLLTEIEALGDTLFGEISREARTVWNKAYAGKTEVTHKALSPLKSMQDKLSGLSFMEPRVAPLADLIGTALSSIPKRGLISGPALLTLQGLVSMLRDPAHLLEHSRTAIDRGSSSEVLECLSRLSVKDFEADGLQPEGLSDIFDEDENLSADSTDEAEEGTIALDSFGLW
jgi:hypothetical protein